VWSRSRSTAKHAGLRSMKYSTTPPPPLERETFQEESSSAPSMESRPALASVVVIVSNTCRPTLNRMLPPHSIKREAASERVGGRGDVAAAAGVAGEGG
jgi:hypothetical protein